VQSFVQRRPPLPWLQSAGWAMLPVLLFTLDWAVPARTQLMSWVFAGLLLPAVLVLWRWWGVAFVRRWPRRFTRLCLRRKWVAA
jgi:hypothetical protein